MRDAANSSATVLIWFLGARTVLTVVVPTRATVIPAYHTMPKKSQHTLHSSTLNDLDISYARGDTVVHPEGDSDAVREALPSVTPLLRSTGQAQQYALVVDAFFDLDGVLLQPSDCNRVGQVEGKRMGQSGRFEEQGQHRDLVVKCSFSTRMTVAH